MSRHGYRGYISSNMQERSVPQNVQQQVIREYCRKNNMEFLLSATEYGNSYKMLKTISEDKKIAGIVLYSIFQLPPDRESRFVLWDKACIDKSIDIHFAAENIHLVTYDDYNKLEDIFLLRGIMNGNK